jgi:hypothetical protein
MGVDRPVLLTRLSLALLPLVLPLLLLGQPAHAAPATEAEMNLYTRIAAVNVCLARAAGIDFDKAVGIAGETITQVIQGQHGGAIQQVRAQPLSLEELRQGSINSAVIGAVEVCPQQVPEDVVKRVQEALKAQPGAQPPAATSPASKAPASKAPAATPAKAAPVAKPSAAQPPAAKPSEAKPSEAKPSEAKPPAAKP